MSCVSLSVETSDVPFVQVSFVVEQTPLTGLAAWQLALVPPSKPVHFHLKCVLLFVTSVNVPAAQVFATKVLHDPLTAGGV